MLATPEDAARVQWLFLDLNSYFASVEQEVQPHLRGQPVVVVNAAADSTCCIAASYEAKRLGVRTGTLVAEAKRLCPRLQVILARHEIYLEYHGRIRAAVERCLPISKVVSIDEVACRLMGREQIVENAVRLAQQVKQAIRDHAGATLRCSIGLAPNQFLAKTASDMRKPDGLTVIRKPQLPQILFPLELQDLCGIGPRRDRRLRAHGVHTVEQLCRLSREQMTEIWGSVLGTRFWLRLRGEDFDDRATHTSSFGHQHVLAPEHRTPEQAAAIAKALLHKAAFRLRQAGMYAGALTLYVLFLSHEHDWGGKWGHQGLPSWQSCSRFPPCQDTMTLLKVLNRAWLACPRHKPLLTGVTLSDLTSGNSLNLFSDLYEDPRCKNLTAAMDTVNLKYGPSTLYLGGVHEVRHTTPLRIAFTTIPGAEWK
ncbi:MAG: DNA polymerase [Acidobacteriales bacterium]|nr:DNA polymerase [Terriglobales bacterium]